MTADIENRLQQIASVITQLDDQKVPRNIRKGAKDAVEKWLLNKNKQLDVRTVSYTHLTLPTILLV